MTRFFIPIILIGTSIAFFFMITNPMYDNTSVDNPGILQLKSQIASYNEALDTSKELAKIRDQLTAQYNAIDPNNLIKLEKLLPDNINSIRLILEIEQIASPYGMVLTNIKYDSPSSTSAKTADTSTVVVQGGDAAQASSKDYGVFDLEFFTTGTYNNFINFTKDLESNLRIIDIDSVSISPNTDISVVNKKNSSDTYNYDFKIKTYWLKD